MVYAFIVFEIGNIIRIILAILKYYCQYWYHCCRVYIILETRNPIRYSLNVLISANIYNLGNRSQNRMIHCTFIFQNIKIIMNSLDHPGYTPLDNYKITPSSQLHRWRPHALFLYAWVQQSTSLCRFLHLNIHKFKDLYT